MLRADGIAALTIGPRRGLFVFGPGKGPRPQILDEPHAPILLIGLGRPTPPPSHPIHGTLRVVGRGSGRPGARTPHEPHAPISLGSTDRPVRTTITCLVPNNIDGRVKWVFIYVIHKQAYHKKAYMEDPTKAALDPRALDRNIMLLLYDAARLIRKDFDRRAKQVGLTTRAQYAVLAHLSYNEGINQNALADILEIEPITLARQLDRLEEAGMVERRPDPNDRRVRTLYLTDGAWPVLDQIRILAEQTRDRAMKNLDNDAQEQLIDLLLHIRNNLSDKPLSASLARDEARS